MKYEIIVKAKANPEEKKRISNVNRVVVTVRTIRLVGIIAPEENTLSVHGKVLTS